MATRQLPDRDIVLIVDDKPANLHMLSTALDQAGFSVLVALDGGTALEQLKLIRPNLILLDAVMPGMDGFETCRQIQANPDTRSIPVVFMTALDDTGHIVQGFADGAVDYVTKPIRPAEIVARVTAHIRRSRAALQARQALDSAQQSAIGVDEQGQILWLTEAAEQLLLRVFGADCPAGLNAGRLPEPLHHWLVASMASEQNGPSWEWCGDGRSLKVQLGRDSSTVGAVLLLSETSAAEPLEQTRERLGLTAREAEILMWVTYGKTNKQIGDILGISPRTVNKHLDHIYQKLGVETRSAAVAIAMKAR